MKFDLFSIILLKIHILLHLLLPISLTASNFSTLEVTISTSIPFQCMNHLNITMIAHPLCQIRLPILHEASTMFSMLFGH